MAEGVSVVCTLSLKIDGEWVEKSDVGSPSDQPDHGDKLKAAFSDSLKRAACKCGIGRYLYKLPRQWVDYDPQTKQFMQTPSLPAWALPAVKQSA
ncbi:MAG: Rad52/Rad22 family DNA repair protein [Gemmataceae bacterium]